MKVSNRVALKILTQTERMNMMVSHSSISLSISEGGLRVSAGLLLLHLEILEMTKEVLQPIF